MQINDEIFLQQGVSGKLSENSLLDLRVHNIMMEIELKLYMQFIEVINNY
jgi:hypothetical protein